MNDVHDTTAPLARSPRRRRIRLSFLLGALLLLVGYAGFDLWAGHSVNVAIARLEKQYGRIDAYPLTVAYVPAGENRARVVRAAATLIALAPGTTDTDFSRAYGGFVTSVPPAPVPTELRNFVEANREALRVADDARTRRQSNWEVEYRSGGERPPLLGIRALSNAIYLSTCLDLRAGQPEDAAKAIATGLAVSGSLRQEPDLLAQLIRIASGTQQFDAVHRLLIESEPSKTSLEDLARWLAEDRTPDPAWVGLVSEMKTFNAVLTQLGSGRSVAYDSPLWLGPLARFGRPVIRLAQARYLRQMGDLLDVQAGPRPRPAPAEDALRRWGWAKWLDYAPSLERSIDSFDRFNSALGATELAVALRRFKIDHGTYPDDLSALVPVYMAIVPIDAFTGQPPVYARQGAGFHLYAPDGGYFPRPADRLMASALDWTVPK